MAEFVTLLLALVGADDELHVVSVQEVLGDVRPPVAAPAPHLVGFAAVLGHGVAPQQVQDLVTNHGEDVPFRFMYILCSSSFDYKSQKNAK